MAITEFDPREEYVGAGNLAAYTFDFKIASLDHILILVTSDTFVETFKVRGTDTTYLSSVEFSSAGGGTVTLAANLPTGHFLTILLANDEPLQESQFKDKGQFTLSRIESALDVLAGAIQRVAYLAGRALKISDSMADASVFDPSIPVSTTDTGVTDSSDRVLAIGDDNASFKLGPTTASIALNAAIAAAAATAAGNSETAAGISATAAAASAASAVTSATTATTQAAAAATSATTATNQAATATTQATNAATSATAAATSASAAATSATASAASATAASASQTAAASSATNASTSETNAATSATTASTQATNAATSATAAAASAAAAAASAGAAVLTIVGSRAVPTAVVAGTGIVFTSTTNNTINFIEGSGGPVVVSAAARIQAGTIVGQRLTLIARTDAKSVTLADGNGIVTGGLTLTLIENSIVTFLWDGSAWVLESTNGLM